MEVVYPEEYEVIYLASDSDAYSVVDQDVDFQSAVLERLDGIMAASVLCACFLFLIFYSMAKRR